MTRFFRNQESKRNPATRCSSDPSFLIPQNRSHVPVCTKVQSVYRTLWNKCFEKVECGVNFSPLNLSSSWLL